MQCECVTGFTAGHGLTLALAVGGWATPAACHFALVARAGRPDRLRAGVAGLFGLVHGLGFAGALEDLALPAPRLAAALLGFNAGVELGQLAVLAAAWPLLAAVRRRGEAAHGTLVRWGSAAAAAAGVFWAVTRVREALAG
jgi:hypothetical protein